MKTVEVTEIRCREDRQAIVANYEYILTDDLGRRSAGSGSVGVARSTLNEDEQKVITRQQVEIEIKRKLGFKSVMFIDPHQMSRGPGRPRREQSLGQ